MDFPRFFSDDMCSYWLSVNSNYCCLCCSSLVSVFYSANSISWNVHRLWQCRKPQVWIMMLYNCLLVDICNDWLAAGVYCWSKAFCRSMWKDSKPGMLYFSFPFDELCTTKYGTFLDFFPHMLYFMEHSLRQEQVVYLRKLQLLH